MACAVSHTGACVEKGHTCDLMLCGCHIEMLNNFLLGVRVGWGTFLFCTGSHKLCSQSWEGEKDRDRKW